MDEDTKNEIHRVEKILDEIRVHTAHPWWRSLLFGFLQGAGWVVGTVFAIFLLGWILSLFGVLPGFAELSSQLQLILKTKF